MSHNRSSRRACLVDGDNLTGGGELSLNAVAPVFERLARLSEGLPVTFAMQRKMAPRYLPAYAGLGWGIRFVSMTPDAADDELLSVAAGHLARDVGDLVVVSGDHAFASLAGRTRLHVCSYRRSLSRRLRLAATTVTYLDDLLPAAA